MFETGAAGALVEIVSAVVVALEFVSGPASG